MFQNFFQCHNPLEKLPSATFCSHFQLQFVLTSRYILFSLSQAFFMLLGSTFLLKMMNPVRRKTSEGKEATGRDME